MARASAGLIVPVAPLDSSQHFACGFRRALRRASVADNTTRRSDPMPSFKVQRFRDGKALTAETVLAGSAASAVERVAGKGLVTEGEEGKHVARVRLPKSDQWEYYWRPASKGRSGR